MCRILGDARGTGAHSARQGHCLSIIDRPVACDTSTPNIRWERYGHCPQPSRDVQLYKRPGFGSLWRWRPSARSERSSGWGGVPRGRRHVLVPPSRATQVRPSPREEYRDVPSRRVGRHGTELAGILSRARGPRRSARQPVSHHPQQRPCRLRAGSVTSRCFPGHLSGQRTLKVSLTNDSPARLTHRPPLVSVA